MVKFICYNWMPLAADHIIDAPRHHYDNAGTTPLHNYPAFNPLKVRDGDTIFVKTDYIVSGQFIHGILPKIFCRFNLITGVSSHNLGREGGDIYKTVLNHPGLVRWFCTNPPQEDNPKIVPLPIGFEEPSRLGGNQKMLQGFFSSRTKRKDKKDKVLLPYHDLSTNPARKKLYDKLRSLSFVDVQEDKLSVEQYLSLLDKYKFIICLEGRGPDVHRNYEAMLVGSIPINKRNVIEKVFDYHSASGIFLDSWDELTEEKYNNLLDKQYNINNNDIFLTLEKYLSLIGGENEN